MTRKLATFCVAMMLCLGVVGQATAAVVPRSADQATTASSMPSGPTDESKVPHYFGPNPNWALSPLTTADVAVEIVGDGTGATAIASVGANGEVTGITITDPGSGYSAATVNITGAGTGATADAVVTASSAVTSVNVTSGGSGYSSPTVTFSGGGGVVSATTVGNPMVDRAFATDYVAPPAVVPAAVTQVANHTFFVSAGNATGGTFTLTVDGATSAPIAFDASAATVEAALTGATVTGAGPWTLVFTANDPVVSIDGAALTRDVIDATAAVGATPDVWNVDVGSATGGSFTLDIDGTLTAPIAWNATALEVETAVSLVTAATVTGSGAAGDPWVITFATAPLAVTADFAGLTRPATGEGVTAAATYEATAGSATGGTFTLDVDGTPTAAIAWNATAAEFEAAMPGATVSGSTPWVIVFANAPTTVTLNDANLTQPAAPLVPVFVVVPTALPAGNLTEFQSWNQATPGGSPVPSAGQKFHAYVLRPTGVADEYDVVFDSGELTVPALSGVASELASYPAGPFAVLAGDVLGFYGAGIPVDTNVGLDRFSYPAPAAPAQGDTVTFGGAGFPDFGQARTYGFGASVAVTAGATQATGTAYGGVDAVALVDPGSGYTMPTVDFDLPDDPNGVTATGHVTCAETDCVAPTPGDPITITGVVVDNPGSGYAKAPNVVIRNGTLFDPIAGATPATATATLTIQTVVLDTYGAGYTTAPDVTFADATGGGTGAIGTAVTQVGSVTSITNLVGGSGYVTGGGIKKFTDDLPGLCVPPACPTTGKYIPLGVPEAKTYDGVAADEYVIGLVQYKTSFSSSLPDTLVRGYVQLETPANEAISQHWPVTNTLMDGTTVPVMKSDGVTPWLAVTPPQWLGPTIAASQNKPVRIVFHNLLPTGSDGDLFLPTDSTLMGSGMLPMPEMAPVNDGSVMDEVRNPACSEYPKPESCFADNRATLHLHGGTTPWISDGTAHQWITPDTETTDWPEGVSVENVPDMDVCKADDDGCQTFYYTNQQSARLLFYHDHSWGITRLNVYAGEAAGYLITDETEQNLINSGTIPGAADTIPLVVQDRTFVPDAAQLALQDPTWDTARWGTKGSFWYHHVYMPAQNPGDPGGMSAYGRWMYGPWFWPPAADTKYGPIANPYYDPTCNLDDPATWTYQTDPFCEPEQIPGTPNISVGMEQFNDTPIVNGTAYPTVTLEPKTYRLRMLNAANDRFFNFQWYVGDPTTASTDLNGNGEVIGATEVALDPADLAAAQTDPVVSPKPVQGAATAGPDWIAIGSEGGFLPAPTVVDGQQPTTWITDPTRFDVGNVDQHSLLLAPAERADAIVDFSKFAGKTLILYNDAPAAFPARVPSYDYYTGAPDLSPNGAPGILPGYGPNTRTIMQVKIAPTAPAAAFNLTKLQNAFKHNANGTGVFESGQHPIIVGQAAYNSAYGTNFAASSNCNAPGSNLQRCDGLVRVSDTSTFGFNGLRNPTSSKLTMALQPKAIHDEMNATTFDEFGRMQANLGVEAQPPTPGQQNVTLYPFVNPATELIDATNLPKQDVTYDANGLPVNDVKVSAISSATDGTQIWRITHNGVDTHPIHFHLYDVQVVNRVTWDNIIIPTDPAELGWKDTVRISPLQDTIVALRPIIPEVPWELPNAIRPLNPMMPLGSTAMFNNFDVQGNPTAQIINQLVNFGWEYVYHCHILSHEEMDMMRPVSVALPPLKADGLTYVVTGNGNNTRLILSFMDNSINETAFTIQRRAGTGPWVDLGTLTSPLDQPNVHEPRSFTDTTFRFNSTAYTYRVVAKNTIGYGGEFPGMTVQSISPEIAVIRAPTGLTAGLLAGPTRVNLTWTDNAANETGFVIERSPDGVNFTQIGTAPARSSTGPTSFADSTVALNGTYAYRVAAVNTSVNGQSAWSNVATTIVSTPTAPATVTVVNGPNQGGNRSVVLSWTDTSVNESGFVVQRATNASFTTGVASTNVAANATGATITGLSRNTNYYFRVWSTNALGPSAQVNAAPFPILTNP
jgi:FtsP/CotA-like multicopper oxidase with cupredoxin domain